MESRLLARKAKWLGVLASVTFALVSASGCSKVQDYLKTDVHRFISPEEVFRPPATGSTINPIYSSIGPADTTQELVPNATFPRDEDWEYSDTDYLLGPTDMVNISILDLFLEGAETALTRVVSTSGYISMPLVPEKIRAEGLNVDQLRASIVEAYRPDILKQPIVSVTISARRQSVYSVLGAVASPGRYPIVRKNMRLLEAISSCGGITQANIRYLYVIRQAPAIRRSAVAAVEEPKALDLGQLPELPATVPSETEAAPPPLEPEPTIEIEDPPDVIDIDEALKDLGTLEAQDEPSARPDTQPVIAPSAMTVMVATSPEALSKPVQEVESLATGESSRFVYTTEGWVRVKEEKPSLPGTEGVDTKPKAQTADGYSALGHTEDADPFGWQEIDKSSLARIIAIDFAKLQDGDWRNNIIVRDNDVIRVPSFEVGEFYVMGQVRRPGPYNLTGRYLTIKQAIAAAGNLAPLAWPENALLIRRVGQNQEQMIPINLEAIFRGEESDTFLKPNDIISVGTDVRAPFYAVMRNAFRMTYGFGFIYDRNFADPYTLPLDSKRFTRF